VDEALQAGILHDIGTLVLATSLPAEHADARRLAETNAMPLHHAEAEIFGCHHARIGAYVLGLWGLPDGIVEAVAYHHDESVPFVRSFCSLVAVSAANAIMHTCSNNPVGGYIEASSRLLETAGCMDRLPVWLTDVAGDLVKDGVPLA
jgi:HD-like signal output (HDOD) protein